MLYVGYLIIVNGQNIKKKMGFEIFHFGAAESGKLHQQVVPQPLAPSKHRNRVKST